jgi:hypothetical protein
MIRVHNPLNFNNLSSTFLQGLIPHRKVLDLFTLVFPKTPLFPGLASPLPRFAEQGRGEAGLAEQRWKCIKIFTPHLIKGAGFTSKNPAF